MYLNLAEKNQASGTIYASFAQSCQSEVGTSAPLSAPGTGAEPGTWHRTGHRCGTGWKNRCGMEGSVPSK